MKSHLHCDPWRVNFTALAMIVTSPLVLRAVDPPTGTGGDGQLALAVSRIDASRNQPPAAAQDSLLDVPLGVDEDIGVQEILTPSSGSNPLRVSIDSGYFWTDNAGLTSFAELEDSYYYQFVGFSYLPELAPNLYGEIYFNQYFNRYAKHSILDYDDSRMGVGLQRLFPDCGNLMLFGGYEFERLLESREHTELFTNHSLNTGLLLPLISDDRHYAYVGWESLFSVKANPELLQRNEHDVVLGCRTKLTESLSTELYYRYRLFDFSSSLGKDENHRIGSLLTCEIFPNLFLTGSASVAFNESAVPFGDYTVWDLGGYLNFRLAF